MMMKNYEKSDDDDENTFAQNVVNFLYNMIKFWSYVFFSSRHYFEILWRKKIEAMELFSRNKIDEINQYSQTFIYKNDGIRLAYGVDGMRLAYGLYPGLGVDDKCTETKGFDDVTELCLVMMDAIDIKKELWAAL
ncbi:hypothetical protein KUTeg_000689, partial [Tegillarca granosa]